MLSSVTDSSSHRIRLLVEISSGEQHMTGRVSLISLSNELNGLIELLEKLFAIGEKGASRFYRHKARKAADSLNVLQFRPRGFRAPLESIAAGKIDTSDVDALASFSGETSQVVVNRVQALYAYLDVVRHQCGAAASAQLEELLDGPDGKFVIRYEIEGLVHMV